MKNLAKIQNPNKIHVTIHFMGILGEKVGSRQLHLELGEGINIQQFLDVLYDKYSDTFPDIFIDSTKRVFKMIHFMKNFKDINLEQELMEKLMDGDNIYFVPPMGGG